MSRPLAVYMALATAACADPAGPSGLGEHDLAGSYVLAAYNASPLPTGVSGTLDLKVDSSFTDAHALVVDSSYTLSVSPSDAWANASSGKWSWTGGNVLFTGAHPGHIFGSILNDGLGITAVGYPALYFRKH